MTASLLERLGPGEGGAFGRNRREDAGAEGLGRGDRPVPRREPPGESAEQREDPVAHDVPSHLLEQVERRRQAAHVVDRQRPRLVAPGAGVRLVAVREVRALGLEAPPARHDRRHAVPRFLRDEEDRAALRAVEPLVRVGGEHVDSRPRDVEGQEAEPLDRVDEEQDAARAAEGRDLLEGKDPAVVERHPGNGDDARPGVDLRLEVLERDAAGAIRRDAAFHAAGFEGAPGIGVGRELHVVRDDVVARLPGEGEGDEVDGPGRVREKRDFFLARADEARGLRPRRLDVAEGAAPVGAAAVPRVLDMRDHRAGDPAGQRRDSRVVQVDELAADRELAVERFGREVEAHRAARPR